MPVVFPVMLLYALFDLLGVGAVVRPIALFTVLLQSRLCAVVFAECAARLYFRAFRTALGKI